MNDRAIQRGTPGGGEEACEGTQYMWVLKWNLTGNMVTSSCNEVIKKINRLNQEYQDKQPVIIEIESLSKKSLTIGVGTKEGLSCLIYFPSPDGLGSMHPVPHNSQYHDCDKSIIFWLNSYDSEYEMKDLITYEEAVKEVIYFLQNDDVSANLSWEPD